MSFAHTIVCLANSKKPHGHCIAGKERLAGGGWRWIRPVGVTDGREITNDDMRFDNSTFPHTLDVVQIEFNKQDNHPYQAENLVIDPNQYWVKTGQVTLQDLDGLVDRPQSLWESGHDSTMGTNDRVPSTLLQGQRESLFLIRPDRMRVTVGAEAAKYDDLRRKVRAHFTYNGVPYALKITDPVSEEYFLARPDGDHNMPNVSYLTVSLAELYKEHAYKVVAAVF
jgi:hypothetical protein